MNDLNKYINKKFISKDGSNKIEVLSIEDFAGAPPHWWEFRIIKIYLTDNLPFSRINKEYSSYIHASDIDENYVELNPITEILFVQNKKMP